MIKADDAALNFLGSQSLWHQSQHVGLSAGLKQHHEQSDPRGSPCRCHEKVPQREASRGVEPFGLTELHEPLFPPYGDLPYGDVAHYVAAEIEHSSILESTQR